MDITQLGEAVLPNVFLKWLQLHQKSRSTRVTRAGALPNTLSFVRRQILSTVLFSTKTVELGAGTVTNSHHLASSGFSTNSAYHFFEDTLTILIILNKNFTRIFMISWILKPI
jgi:hypothetical protein